MDVERIIDEIGQLRSSGPVQISQFIVPSCNEKDCTTLPPSDLRFH